MKIEFIPSREDILQFTVLPIGKMGSWEKTFFRNC